jgi:hypothetical protein
MHHIKFNIEILIIQHIEYNRNFYFYDDCGPEMTKNFSTSY